MATTYPAPIPVGNAEPLNGPRRRLFVLTPELEVSELHVAVGDSDEALVSDAAARAQVVRDVYEVQGVPV
jgi:hypothetical protein